MQATQVIPQWTVGDRLRKAREHAGLDQAAFAAATGISRGTVQNYEADRFGKTRSGPGVLQLRAWAHATGVPEEWLLTGVDMTKAPAAVATEASSVCAPWDLNPEPADAGQALVSGRVGSSFWRIPTQRHVARDEHELSVVRRSGDPATAVRDHLLTIPVQPVAGRHNTSRAA